MYSFSNRLMKLHVLPGNPAYLQGDRRGEFLFCKKVETGHGLQLDAIMSNFNESEYETPQFVFDIISQNNKNKK